MKQFQKFAYFPPKTTVYVKRIEFVTQLTEGEASCGDFTAISKEAPGSKFISGHTSKPSNKLMFDPGSGS